MRESEKEVKKAAERAAEPQNKPETEIGNSPEEEKEKLLVHIRPLKVDMGRYRKYPTDGIF